MLDYPYRNLPDYYPTMYLDGYTPTEILAAIHKTMNKKYDAMQAEKELSSTIEKNLKTTLDKVLNEMLKDFNK